MRREPLETGTEMEDQDLNEVAEQPANTPTYVPFKPEAGVDQRELQENLDWDLPSDGTEEMVELNRMAEPDSDSEILDRS